MVKRNVRRKTLAPENVAKLIEEGFRCYERGNKPGAEKKLRAACAIRPPVSQAHYNLGYFYNLEGRWDEAEKALLKALEHQPDYSRALFTLASVYMEAGRLDRAQAKFLATERLTPDDLDIQLNLGILAIRAGRSEEALARLNRCIEAGHSADAARFRHSRLSFFLARVRAGKPWNGFSPVRRSRSTISNGSGCSIAYSQTTNSKTVSRNSLPGS